MRRDPSIWWSSLSGAAGSSPAGRSPPPPRMIGAEPAAVGQWTASLAAGRPVRVPVEHTIADGLQIASPGELTFAVIQALVKDVVGVEDAEMLTAMRWLFERQKLVVEPSGSAALAAVLSGRIDVHGLRVGIILSGGNIAIDRFLQLMTPDSGPFA